MATFEEIKNKNPRTETYLAKVSRVESGNNPNAKNPYGSATGLFQFTEDTWKGMNRQYGLNYTLEDRKNPEKAAQVMRLFTEDNERSIKKSVGRELTDADRYMAHFLGAGGANKFYSVFNSNPSAPISTVMSQKALDSNRSVAYNKNGSIKTVSDVYNWAATKMNETPEDRYQAQYGDPVPDFDSFIRKSHGNLETSKVNYEEEEPEEVKEASKDISEKSFMEDLQKTVKSQQEQIDSLQSNLEPQEPKKEETGYTFDEMPDPYNYINIEDGLEEYESGGTTPYEVYESKTGKKWATAKAEGLTDGSAEQNLRLMRRLQDNQPAEQEVQKPIAKPVNYYKRDDKEYFSYDKKELNEFDSAPLDRYNPETDTFQAEELPEIEIKNSKKFSLEEFEMPYREIEDSDCKNYYGCVNGGVTDMARTLGVSKEVLRKKNNMYGDAWTIIDNTFGQEVDIKEGYGDVKPGDIVSLTRGKFKSDKENNIPESEQHFGYVTRIVDGKPQVKHYVNAKNSYYEEPIDNISQFHKYKAQRVKRPDGMKDIKIDNKKIDSPYYSGSVQEKEVIKTMNEDKESIQKTLRLDSDEYDRAAKLSYGIIGAESDFGQSKRAAIRMALPDLALEATQLARGKYNANYNPISKGYSSVKESSLYNISDDRDIKGIQEKIGLTGNQVDGIWGKTSAKYLEEYNKANPNNQIKFDSLKEKLDKGDFSNLSKTKNFAAVAMSEMGIDADDLENPGNAFKATMAIVAKEIKRNPNITQEQILEKYTGGTSIRGYKDKVKRYQNNLDNNRNNDVEVKTKDFIYGAISKVSNITDDIKKSVKSKIVDFLSKNTKELPINFRALATTVSGSNATITESHLSKSATNKLKDIVRNNISKNKNLIEYGDYGNDTFGDVGGQNSKGTLESITEALTNESSILKQFLGQATIVDKGGGIYEVIDTYDFNNKGESFGVVDDVKKKGASPYNIVRSIGTNYGKANNLGNKVKIRIDLNK